MKGGSLTFAIVPFSLFLSRRRLGLFGEQILSFVIIGDRHPVGLPVFFCGSFFIHRAHFGVGHSGMGIVISLCHEFPVIFLGLTPLHVGHIRDLGKNCVAFWGF